MGIADFAKDAFEKAKDIAGDVAENVQDFAGDAVEKAKDVAGDVTEKVQDVFDGDDEPAA